MVFGHANLTILFVFCVMFFFLGVNDPLRSPTISEILFKQKNDSIRDCIEADKKKKEDAAKDALTKSTAARVEYPNAASQKKETAAQIKKRKLAETMCY